MKKTIPIIIAFASVHIGANAALVSSCFNTTTFAADCDESMVCCPTGDTVYIYTCPDGYRSAGNGKCACKEKTPAPVTDERGTYTITFPNVAATRTIAQCCTPQPKGDGNPITCLACINKGEIK